MIDKKLWIVMMVFGIVCIGPANAVQIESVNQLNIKCLNEDKKLKNIETPLNDNNASDINKTVTNETNNNTTITNPTKDNTTIMSPINDNNTLTNGTMVNTALMNETGDLNKTIGNGTNNSTENTDNQISHEVRSKVLLTVTAIASISLAAATVCALIPDCTATKWLAGGCAVFGGCCFIAAIIINWCWW